MVFDVSLAFRDRHREYAQRPVELTEHDARYAQNPRIRLKHE